MVWGEWFAAISDPKYSRVHVSVSHCFFAPSMTSQYSRATDPIKNQALNCTITGPTVTVDCADSNGLVQINGDKITQCFLYGPTDLPAPPVMVFCNTTMPVHDGQVESTRLLDELRKMSK